MSRKIIHLDLDAFFCAVEEIRDPSLRGKPFAVGGQPDERGVVASCSYPARRFGIHSAMPMAHALRLCPSLIIVSPRHGFYGEYSSLVFKIARRTSELIEQISIDEAFLEISETAGTGEEIARTLQKSIYDEQMLPSSLGVASNKLVAKIANDFGKSANRGSSPPNAITIVPPGQEAAFLAPMPVEMLWGVGAKTAARMRELGIFTIGELASWPAVDLVRRFGKNGYDLSRHALGIDDSPIITIHEIKSISQETTFVKDVSAETQLKQVLEELSGQVGKRLRQDNLSGSTVKLKIRWPDFTTYTRQASFNTPIQQDREIFETVIELFDKIWKTGQPVRLLGVGVSGLHKPARQLSLWNQPQEQVDFEAQELFDAETADRQRRLEIAIEEIRQRFGTQIIKRGNITH